MSLPGTIVISEIQADLCDLLKDVKGQGLQAAGRLVRYCCRDVGILDNLEGLRVGLVSMGPRLLRGKGVCHMFQCSGTSAS